MAEPITSASRTYATFRAGRLVPVYKLDACKVVLAERERELLEIKGACPTCRLHYAHSGPCDVDTGGQWA